MANNKDEATAKRAGPAKNNNRGTQNELEILRMIVLESPGIRTMVFDRLRAVKARSADTNAIKAKLASENRS